MLRQQHWRIGRADGAPARGSRHGRRWTPRGAVRTSEVQAASAATPKAAAAAPSSDWTAQLRGRPFSTARHAFTQAPRGKGRYRTGSLIITHAEALSPSDQGPIGKCRVRGGSFLLRQPDIIVPDLDGPRSFTLIDVKIFDPAAPSYADSSAKSAQHRHRALEAAGPREYFGASRRPPPGSRMRICTFVVSSFGSLGTQALGLIKDIGRRTNLFVPPALAHETSWATMSITSFLRSAITFQVRKRIAVFLRDHLPDDFIPPPPHAITACEDVNDVDHADASSIMVI